MDGQKTQLNKRWWNDNVNNSVIQKSNLWKDWKNEQKCEVFKIGKKMVKTNQYITGGCLTNDDGVLAVRDESKKWLGNIVTRSC